MIERIGNKITATLSQNDFLTKFPEAIKYDKQDKDTKDEYLMDMYKNHNKFYHKVKDELNPIIHEVLKIEEYFSANIMNVNVVYNKHKSKLARFAQIRSYTYGTFAVFRISRPKTKCERITKFICFWKNQKILKYSNYINIAYTLVASIFSYMATNDADSLTESAKAKLKNLMNTTENFKTLTYSSMTNTTFVDNLVDLISYVSSTTTFKYQYPMLIVGIGVSTLATTNLLNYYTKKDRQADLSRRFLKSAFDKTQKNMINELREEGYRIIPHDESVEAETLQTLKLKEDELPFVKGLSLYKPKININSDIPHNNDIIGLDPIVQPMKKSLTIKR